MKKKDDDIVIDINKIIIYLGQILGWLFLAYLHYKFGKLLYVNFSEGLLILPIISAIIIMVFTVIYYGTKNSLKGDKNFLRIIKVMMKNGFEVSTALIKGLCFVSIIGIFAFALFFNIFDILTALGASGIIIILLIIIIFKLNKLER